MQQKEATRAGSATTTVRQTFTGRDDLMLLRLVESVRPWSHRGSVMGAWDQIAQTMNADTTSALTGLTAATTRARFFRMVSQRRDRQDKMLRRGTVSDQEYQAKLERLDAVIVHLNTFEEEVSLTSMLNEVDNDSEESESIISLGQIQPTHVALLQAAVKPSIKKPKSSTVSSSKQGSSLYETNVVGNSPVTPKFGTMLMGPVPKRPIIDHVASVVGAPPKQSHQQVVSVCEETPASGVRISQDDAINEGWLSVANRALSLIGSKLEIDRETAIAERLCRQEEAKVRANELSAAQEQTKQLIQAVLSLVQASSNC